MQNQEEYISQGAEARIYKRKFMGEVCIIKERFIKKYRIKEIDDKITKKRILSVFVLEVRYMAKARKVGIETPIILFVNLLERKIYMEFITNSVTLKFFVNNKQGNMMVNNVMKKYGEDLAKLHNIDIIHGDLTTSNCMIQSENQFNKYILVPTFHIYSIIDSNEVVRQIEKSSKYTLFWIDFGLSARSNSVEDKAVDLYVLCNTQSLPNLQYLIERAFLSTHPNSETYFSTILTSYFQTSTNSKKIKKRFEDVQKRGRKRSMAG